MTDNLSHGLETGVLLANVELIPIEVDHTIVIENIYYDYNKWNIRPDAAEELDKIAVILRDNPTVLVELGSHTDSRGKDDYNMELSQKRAHAAVEYLIDTGNVSRKVLSHEVWGEKTGE